MNHRAYDAANKWVGGTCQKSLTTQEGLGQKISKDMTLSALV